MKDDMTSKYQKEIDEIEKKEFLEENKIYHLFNVYLVGGAVRDMSLGIDPKDKDYVVVGATEKDMLDLGFEKVGADFPVFLHPKTKEEYALARKERKVSAGYNGFICETNNVTIEDDLLRRDLTINAMAIRLNEFGKPEGLLDPYNGLNDLHQKNLKHVSSHFSEDPVRILRIARFSARYNFKIDDETIKMMKSMVENGEFDTLTPERVFLEFDKVIHEKYLIRFFQILDEIGALKNLGNFDVAMIQKDLEMIQEIRKMINFQVNLLNLDYQDHITTPVVYKIQNDISDYDFFNHGQYPLLLINENDKKNKRLEWGVIFQNFENAEMDKFKIPNHIQKEIVFFKRIKIGILEKSFEHLNDIQKVELLTEMKATHQKDSIFSFILYTEQIKNYLKNQNEFSEVENALRYYYRANQMDKKINVFEITQSQESQKQKQVNKNICQIFDMIEQNVQAIKAIDYQELQKEFKNHSQSLKMRDFIIQKQIEAIASHQNIKKSLRM